MKQVFDETLTPELLCGLDIPANEKLTPLLQSEAFTPRQLHALAVRFGDRALRVYASVIPNDPRLRWATLAFQAAILDPQNGRPTPVTMTNALGITIR